jgi:integrase/recombinase XerD
MSSRRCMPVAEWPDQDQTLWRRALTAGGLLDEGGLAEDWRPDTRKKVSKSYGRFLTFLDEMGWLDQNSHPATRTTRERVRAYVDLLKGQVASKTLAGRITDLGEVLRVMAPDDDLQWLRRLGVRLGAQVIPVRNKHSKLVHSEDLHALGINLMERALRERGPRPCSSAVMYRDGLMIALLAVRPFRLRTYSRLRIDHHVIRQLEGYILKIRPEDNKTKRDDVYPVPDDLVAALDHYIQVERPKLLGNRESDRLWISWEGRDLADGSVHDTIEKRTKAAFGHAISPHLFRDCAATSIAVDDPEHVRIIKSILGHGSEGAGEKYYNQGRSLDAQRNMTNSLRARRRLLHDRQPARRR